MWQELCEWWYAFHLQEALQRCEWEYGCFFQLANELPGVKGEIVEKGRVYYLTFLECTCHLCKKGYVTTPLLCECSRQSVIYSMQNLWREQKFNVTLCHSILQGKRDCKIKIEVI